MKLIPHNFFPEIEIRISKILDQMQKEEIQLFLIAANPNIYYTSGRFFRGYTLITIDGKVCRFVVKPQIFDNEENVFFIRKPEEIPDILSQRFGDITQNLNNIALEEDDLYYSDIIRLKNLFPSVNLKNASSILKKARMVKTDWEIDEMRYDGFHQAKVYGEVKDCYHDGMTDLQLQIEIERRLRLEGCLGVSRVAGNLMEINLGSVISGNNADNPAPYEFTMGGSGMHPSLPVGSDNSRIVKGKTIMIDMNGAFNGYQTDMTRVWALGSVSPLALKAHECSIKILRRLEKIAVPGFPVKDLYEEAVKIVENDNLKDFFMGHKSKVGFIGHGVGIQLNELPVITPRSKDILEENVTMAIEPKFVIPEVGAVGIENTYVVTKSGLKNLTEFPEEIQYL